MRRIFISIATLAAVLGLRAEGYQVNTLSSRQTGMGHVGVAMKLGAESQLFNPGALAFSDKTFDISASVAAISAYATATYHVLTTRPTTTCLHRSISARRGVLSTVSTAVSRSIRLMARRSTGESTGPALCSIRKWV